ncbi:hypothetical protein QFW80_16655 [Luteimonas sp. M1R5S18]|uniref:Uncharacterized protein n=1 Tax=Luteimonas rhizosphaericola TaxID=3042024 RepID=A0ABT6JN92_9GAMM|nr:hypothetical protein [Luteimonas rhizosphaericola]MDH5832150.1 hypothetical protein [Luteimonas rhizosphaericola]
MAEPKLTTTQRLAAKSLATEVVLLALLREKRDDHEFWQRLERIMQGVLALDQLQENTRPDIAAMAEEAQHMLDTWRAAVGTDPNGPAPPGSGPFQP